MSAGELRECSPVPDEMLSGFERSSSSAAARVTALATETFCTSSLAPKSLATAIAPENFSSKKNF